VYFSGYRLPIDVSVIWEKVFYFTCINYH